MAHLDRAVLERDYESLPEGPLENTGIHLTGSYDLNAYRGVRNHLRVQDRPDTV